MEADERRKIEAALTAADLETLKEIIREAESFLGDQMKAGLAADSRAMTLAGILAAITSFLIGSSASLFAAKALTWPYLVPVAVAVVCLLGALLCAILAARPTTFQYAGNSPKYWVEDVEASRPLKDALASQAAFCARDIDDNTEVLRKNHKWIKLALWLALGRAAAFAFLELYIILYQIDAGAFGAARRASLSA